MGGCNMEFTLKLDKEIMIKYAKFIGYEEEDIKTLNENESFISTITEIIENTCEGSIF